MNQVTAVILTRNEEKNIERCLNSIKWADDIVVIDHFSTDKTVQICKSNNARVFQRELDGFSQQKQFGVDKALYDWVFIIDADEFTDDELQTAIHDWKSREPKHDAYEIYRKSLYLGKWIRYCNWYLPIIRLFHRKKGRLDGRLVHENIVVAGDVGRLPGNLIHPTYENLSHHIEKVNLYTSYDAKEIARRKVILRPTNYIPYLVMRPVYAFLNKYLRQKGYKEGIHGLILSVITAFVVFITYAKLWEYQKGQSSSSEEVP
jgi:glycosyltransferase involved in cell wall biosynthesis